MKKHFVICGSWPDTGNLGVSALGNSAISALHAADNSTDFTVLDFGKGQRFGPYCVGDRDIQIGLCGAKHSRRIHQPESFYNIGLFARLRPVLNPISKHLLKATAFLDVAGGDSFTDLYGDGRFAQVNAPKKFALANDIPLVFLPQTYGPFLREKTRKQASELVKRSKLAWARDQHSYGILKDLLGDDFDSTKHKLGVDMAFALPMKAAPKKVIPRIRDWIERDDTPLVGLNISGLIYNDPDKARLHYKFKADYHASLEELMKRILAETDARIVLIPHVLAPLGHYESDYQASLSLVEKLRLQNSERVAIQTEPLDQCEVKWLISRMSWFMGTRMHATIAALSTETPVCTISYSDKALGVFESCGVGSSVVDPRRLSTDDVVSAVMASLKSKDSLRTRLQQCLPAVKGIAMQQLQAISQHFD